MTILAILIDWWPLAIVWAILLLIVLEEEVKRD